MRLGHLSGAQIAVVAIVALLVVGAGAVVLDGSGPAQESPAGSDTGPATTTTGQQSTETTPTSQQPESATGPTELSSCTVVDTAGVYELQRNVTASGADSCLTIRASDVTLHGNGHAIGSDGGSAETAITVSSARNVTVANVTVTGWDTGVLVDRTANSVVESSRFAALSDGGVVVRGGSTAAVVRNNTVRNVSGAGISLNTAADSTVADNELTDVEVGVHVINSTDVRTAHNRIVNSDSHGVLYGLTESALTLDQSKIQWTTPAPSSSGNQTNATDRSNQTDARQTNASVTATNRTADEYHPDIEGGIVENNTVLSSDDHGVLLVAARNVSIADNTIEGNNDGVHLVHATRTSITANAISENADDGIALEYALNNTMARNEIDQNTNDGVYVVGDDNDMRNNTLTANGDDAIDVHVSSGNSISDNRIVRNRDDGVYLRNTTHTEVRGNVIQQAGDDGVELRRSLHATVVGNEICFYDGHRFIQRDGSWNVTVHDNLC